MTQGAELIVCVVTAASLLHCATVVESPPDGGGTGGTGNVGGTGGTPGDDCDPVSQTGCSFGEKCSQVVLSSSDGSPLQTRCVAEGTRELLESCSLEDVGDYESDDCAAGLVCFGDVCLEICDARSDACGGMASCQEGPGTFPDRADVGLCFPSCDPLAPDCPGAAGCFVAAADGDRICAEPNPDKEQGAPCGFANDCAAGYGCLLISVTDETLTCAFFCDPEGESPQCADGPGEPFACVRIVDFYMDAGYFGEDLGFCVDPDVFPR